MYDVIIIGAGAAGLTAAIYTRRRGRTVLLLEKQTPGGEITRAPLVENYPGCPGVRGGDLAQRMLEQATELGTEVVSDEVIDVRPGESFTVVGDRTYEGRSVIIATGTKHRRLGVHREDELTGRGVSYCATCDGPLYRGKEIAVIGGGNTAVGEALLLAEECRCVTVVQNLEYLTADSRLCEQLAVRPNVRVLYGVTVAALEGEQELTGLVLARSEMGSSSDRVVDPAEKNVDQAPTSTEPSRKGERDLHAGSCARVSQPQTEQTLAVDGVFIAIGQEPQNQPFRKVCELDANGYIVAGQDCRTQTPGVFAAGDCRAKELRQLVTATADGACAAYAACRYVEEHSR